MTAVQRAILSICLVIGSAGYAHGQSQVDKIRQYCISNGGHSLNRKDGDNKSVGVLGQPLIGSIGRTLDSVRSGIGFLYKVKDGLSAVDHPPITMPRAFALENNYPNPFSSRTVIPFTISSPQIASATIRIIDIMGKERFSIVLNELAAGDHAVVFAGDNLSCGVYQYLLEIEDEIHSRYMTIVR